MDLVFLKILNMSLAASFLIAAVMLLRKLLKKAPKALICLLWAVAAVRLICPLSFESALSLLPSAAVVPETVITENAFAIHTGIEFIDTPASEFVKEQITTAAGVPQGSGSRIMRSLGFVWLSGSLAMFLYAAASWLKIKRKVREGVPKERNVMLCDHIETPFILGIVRPKIYVPSALPTAQYSYVIAHELAHIKRRDYLWKPLGFLLLSVHWFNPLCWAGYILLCRDIELACDEKVIAKLGAYEKKAYSKALLSCSTAPKMIAACPLAFGEVGVKERIKTVLNYKKPAFWVILVTACAFIVVAICFLTNPLSAKTAELFGRDYRVSSIVYEAGYYNFCYTTESAPRYRLTENGKLLVLNDTVLMDQRVAGALEDIKLTADNFEQYFRTNEIWSIESAAELLRDNSKAWRVIVPTEQSDTVFYYLLQQKNGDVYITYGYYGETADESSIRWVFKLQEFDPTADIFGRNYSVADVAFSAPMFSFAYSPEIAPDYRLSADKTLMLLEKNTTNWNALGQLESVQLSEARFDYYFSEYDEFSGWQDDSLNAEKLRTENAEAFRLDVPNDPNHTFYLLLRQQNGQVYLTYGYDDGLDAPSEKKVNLIRWVFLLNEQRTTDDISDIEASDIAAE